MYVDDDVCTLITRKFVSVCMYVNNDDACDGHHHNDTGHTYICSYGTVNDLQQCDHELLEVVVVATY